MTIILGHNFLNVLKNLQFLHFCGGSIVSSEKGVTKQFVGGRGL